MNRRGFLGFLGLAGAAAAVPVAAVATVALSEAAPEAIQGVGVLRYPAYGPKEQGDKVREFARKLCEEVRPGTTLALPNTRDRDGNYFWDFRIEAGDPKQVRVERCPT